MRKRFEIQLELGAKPIEEIEIPKKSRDELPPVLKALQYIYITPEINEKVFGVIEERIPASKQGRPGLSLWEILVLGTVRLTLDINYDRLEHEANYDSLVRDLMGINTTGLLQKQKKYSLTSLKENISKVDEKLLEEINEIVVKEGHQIKKKEGEKLRLKIDSYVLESTVHFPTDITLLLDSGRKVIDTLEDIMEEVTLEGWRKSSYWKRSLKNISRRIGIISRLGGKQKEERIKGEVANDSVCGVKKYLLKAREIKQKLSKSKEEILSHSQSVRIIALLEELYYYEQMLDKHIDLVERRIIKGEKIAHGEKIFSIFEPYTEWIQKGKSGRSAVELGLKVAIGTDQYGFILAHRVMEKEQDVEVAVPMVRKIREQYEIGSASFDKGFWSPKNKEGIREMIAVVVMPKKGKLNKEESHTTPFAELEYESSKNFKALRKQHSAVESNINSLEYHGLNRCPDKGIKNFRKYTALGVLSYNLHILGKLLIEGSKSRAHRKAA